jgi:hypothetical protein
VPALNKTKSEEFAMSATLVKQKPSNAKTNAVSQVVSVIICCLS